MKYNCGENAPKTATYKVVDKKGKVVGTVHCKKGDSFPPTSESGCHYEID